ncbi:hypothetical protein VPHD239_0094 [Vibrio phage D239]
MVVRVHLSVPKEKLLRSNILSKCVVNSRTKHPMSSICMSG